MEIKPSAIILRERVPTSQGESAGWIILLAGQVREREVLAVIAYETGLECTRAFAKLLATKYKVTVKEELRTESGVTANQDSNFTYYS